MEFSKKDPPSAYSKEEWQCENTTLAVLPFLFGQSRIQIWFGPGPYPNIVMPNF